MSRIIPAAAALLGALLAAGPAAADAIYGHWCHGDEHLEVRVDSLTTPGRHSPAARIDRHNALYTAPEGERDAGMGVALQVLSDDIMARYLVDTASGLLSPDRELWDRCAPPPDVS